jgi:hypothetical protein
VIPAAHCSAAIASSPSERSEKISGGQTSHVRGLRADWAAGLFGINDTIERRRGARVRAKGIFHARVRSSHRHFGKARGLPCLGVMLRPPIPWAVHVGALPVLAALAPSEAREW